MAKKCVIIPLLREMEIGEEQRFPADRYRSISVTCSDYGFMTGKKFRVSKDQENRVVVVTREK